MKQLLIALGVIILIVVGWWLFATPAADNDQVATVTDEITQLETELASIQAAVDSGTLTVEQAVAAQERVIARLDAINSAVDGAQKAKLTPSQRMMLEHGLERLKTVLITYRSTLEAVDEQVSVLPEQERPVLKRGGDSKATTLAAVVAETVDVVEVYAETVIDDYDPEDTEPEMIETATSSDQVQEDENMTDDESATSSDEVITEVNTETVTTTDEEAITGETIEVIDSGEEGAVEDDTDILEEVTN